MGSFFSKELTEEEMATIQKTVEDIIANNKVVVFSKTHCRKYFPPQSSRVVTSVYLFI